MCIRDRIPADRKGDVVIEQAQKPLCQGRCSRRKSHLQGNAHDQMCIRDRLCFVLVGAAEELLFRGVIAQTLLEHYGTSRSGVWRCV